MIKNNIKNYVKYLLALLILAIIGIFLYKFLYKYVGNSLFPENHPNEEVSTSFENSDITFNIPRDCYIADSNPSNYKTVGDIQKDMNTSKFWVSNYKDSSSLIMNYDKIKELNNKITKQNLNVYDLKNYSMPSKEDISNYIKTYLIDLKNFYNDDKVRYSSKDELNLFSNMNLENINPSNPIQYGLTITKTNIRSYPTNSGAYKNLDSINLDLLQQSSLEINEPIIILHESLDKKWYFIQGYNYRGWCEASNIAFVEDKNTLFNYLENTKFIMVTGNHVNASSLDGSLNLSYNMGSKIFLYEENDAAVNNISDKIYNENYIIKIPSKNENNNLIFKIGKLSFKEDTNYGYLPYTVGNVIIQSFKSLGEPYDWGNKFNGRDCSGYVSAIYNTMGFRLPRDTDPMENMPLPSLKLNENKETEIKKLLPGSLIFMKNHVMMYLGNYNNSNYIIHAFLGTGDGTQIKQVAVTKIDIPFNNSATFLDKCTSAITLK